jgi:hypothetical protein
MHAPVLVLNASYEPLATTSVGRAFGLVLADKAEIVEADAELAVCSAREREEAGITLRVVPRAPETSFAFAGRNEPPAAWGRSTSPTPPRWDGRTLRARGHADGEPLSPFTDGVRDV